MFAIQGKAAAGVLEVEVVVEMLVEMLVFDLTSFGTTSVLGVSVNMSSLISGFAFPMVGLPLLLLLCPRSPKLKSFSAYM